MSTITLSRLKNVEDAEFLMSLVQDNMEILAEEIARRVTTSQSGSPTTIIGPPISGRGEGGFCMARGDQPAMLKAQQDDDDHADLPEFHWR